MISAPSTQECETDFDYNTRSGGKSHLGGTKGRGMGGLTLARRGSD